MTYLVTFGLSAFHGSELAVGWQWYRRLKELGDVCVIAHAQFQRDEYLPPSARDDVVFVGKAPRVGDEVNRHHVRYAYLYWLGVLKYLRTTAKKDDCVVIVSPAAAWFLPLLVGLPMGREKIFYGPLGVMLVNARLVDKAGTRARMHLRNRSMALFVGLWRLLWRHLPGNLALRVECQWFVDHLGRRYSWVGCLPEVESTADYEVSRGALDLDVNDAWLVVWDDRPQRNAKGSLECALTLAANRGGKVYILGAKGRSLVEIEAQCHRFSASVELMPRLERASFRRFLCAARPTIVTLSLSEGVPSLLFEGLVDGCAVLSYGVGGISWLERWAASVEKINYRGRVLRSIRWNVESETAYRRAVSSGFRDLACRIMKHGETTAQARKVER